MYGVVQFYSKHQEYPELPEIMLRPHMGTGQDLFAKVPQI